MQDEQLHPAFGNDSYPAILSIEYISIAQHPATYYFLFFFFSPFGLLLILGFNQSLSIQLSSIFRRLFRVFAHIYYSHRSHIAEKHQAKIADSTTNTTKNSTESTTSLLDKSFKHFLHLSQGNPSRSTNSFFHSIRFPDHLILFSNPLP